MEFCEKSVQNSGRLPENLGKISGNNPEEIWERFPEESRKDFRSNLESSPEESGKDCQRNLEQNPGGM